MISRPAIFTVAFAALLLCGVRVRADYPTEVGVKDVETTAAKCDSDFEVGANSSYLILTPRARRNNSDGKYGQPYHAATHIYIPDPNGGSGVSARYSQRFIVYGAEQSARPAMLKVGRLLALLWQLVYTHMRRDHSPTGQWVQVWMSDHKAPGLTADVAGEEFKNQIYLYDVEHDRIPMEWMREVAHEYGHYSLPGISGFKEPEEWANGVLGERLFISWIDKGLVSGDISADRVPFAGAADIRDYMTKQVDPLVKRAETNPVTGAELERRDTEGMDNYTALAIYIDRVYGSAQLLAAMAETEPAKRDSLPEAPDFLRGFLRSITSAEKLTLTVSAPPVGGCAIYLQAGRYTVEAGGRNWSVRLAGKDLPRSGEAFRAPSNGWYRFMGEAAADYTAVLRMQH